MNKTKDDTTVENQWKRIDCHFDRHLMSAKNNGLPRLINLMLRIQQNYFHNIHARIREQIRLQPPSRRDPVLSAQVNGEPVLVGQTLFQPNHMNGEPDNNDVVEKLSSIKL